MSDLNSKQCIPCQGGVPPLEESERLNLLKEIHPDWELTHNNSRLKRKLSFDDFKKPMDLAIQVGELAEQQWHHPDLKIAWGTLEIEIWTHKIDSLVESDFIFAAKVDSLVANSSC